MHFHISIYTFGCINELWEFILNNGIILRTVNIFADIQSATDALELVHGYQFKGRPIIIQFGRKQT